MRVLRVKIVARTIQIRRHHTAIVDTMLSVIAFAQLDPGNLRDRIGLVRRLQRAGQKRVFPHRLGCFARIDAG